MSAHHCSHVYFKSGRERAILGDHNTKQGQNTFERHYPWSCNSIDSPMTSLSLRDTES